MNARPSRWPALLLSGAFGALIWALSPLFTGHTEPWDAGAYLPLALLVSGVLTGALFRAPGWVYYLGVLGAQAAFLLVMSRADPMAMLGMLFLLGYSLLFLLGALAGRALSRRRARV